MAIIKVKIGEKKFYSLITGKLHVLCISQENINIIDQKEGGIEFTSANINLDQKATFMYSNLVQNGSVNNQFEIQIDKMLSKLNC